MSKITEAMVDAAWQAFGDCPIDMCGDHDEEQKKCVVAAVEAALSAGQAPQPVAIKPLEWEYVERKTMTYTAFWADGDVAYYIDQSFGSDSYYFRTIRWPEETIYDGDDLPSAKAAAQSDYEARIRSALVPPAVPGEVEKPTVCVGEMKTSAGSDYYVCVRVGDRELTPHMHKIRSRAEYEVAEWQWLFNGGEKPDILAYREDASLSPPAVPGEVEETWRCDECDCRSYALIDKKLPNGTYAPGNDKRCVHCKKVHLAKLADALPSGHVVLEQADMPDGRVSQTVRGRDGIEYERIVHGDEAYGEDE